ncbi:mannose-6-phosphate isomerase, class I [Mergibacter septicus]|uniref:mannose-6-phosphate isomerase n=1 Tax=Mergibacter septicus TaxID=221402 RepID=A0A8E3S822_9PAST|nr:mannose-6-phosphate isomerase, class I [Mergibacter septicus]AWX14761.1 mannose-6-phosphate isomerase, class I [Mergibacter septicus]QDJ14012.1 mannose-6-phosphate isomerase, class I [Mergibacter septicus]UTU48539.1 mannose-6-phosphate isomerase, class I [Mergibacter septicus]WMR95832.1 mannose-6-phosphate isomerase, class I [Mergibacter septicus]
MIYQLEGKAQNYIWGGKEYIPHLFQFKAEQPYYAEWWLGTHPLAPSQLLLENQERLLLSDYIAQNPIVLGEKSRQLFADELPYLLKILDVAQPLSIQLHPTKEQAEQGYLVENQQGILLTDAKRTYKDRNHKPEMMIALSDFWLLHGFKSKTDIVKTLSLHPSLKVLAEKLLQTDIHSFYAEIMQASQSQLAEWLLPIFDQYQIAYQDGKLNLDNPDYWVLYTQEAMNISRERLDPGLLCFYLFNLVHLKKGEGIFQAAGIPHAYLRGQNIELMACSDNVIRGGLTPKYVDIPQLLSIIDCQEITPSIISPASNENGIFTYQTPTKDFALSNLNYQQNIKLDFTSSSATILLVMEGEIEIIAEEQKLVLSQGKSIFMDAKTACQIIAKQNGYAVLAHLPDFN